MATLDMAAFSNALKILYPAGLEEVWYPECPFLAWVPKDYNFEGASKQINPIYSGIRGSTSFATALSTKSAPSIAKFNVTRVKDYVLGAIDNEALKASRSQKGAVAQALKTQIDAAMYEFGRSAAFQCWGDGTGTRGVVDSVMGFVVELDDKGTVVNFEVGMLLQVKSGGMLQPGQLLVTKVDRDAGLLTVSLVNGAMMPMPTDTLARDGDYTGGGANVLAGVLSWIPKTTPTATPFFGVDRSVDPARLAGIRVAGAGQPIEEIVFSAQAAASINGARVDTLWINSKRYAELCKNIQSKAWYPQNNGGGTVKATSGRSGKVDVGFPGFVFAGERGPVTVVADPSCPYSHGLMTRKEAWELASLDEAPHFAEEDGRKFLREQSADAIEFRLKSYWQLICQRPVDNVLIGWDV